jgi:hypothetical protein
MRQSKPKTPDLPPDEYELEERAAILEFEAGYSRETAERLARKQIAEHRREVARQREKQCDLPW